MLGQLQQPPCLRNWIGPPFFFVFPLYFSPFLRIFPLRPFLFVNPNPSGFIPAVPVSILFIPEWERPFFPIPPNLSFFRSWFSYLLFLVLLFAEYTSLTLWRHHALSRHLFRLEFLFFACLPSCPLLHVPGTGFFLTLQIIPPHPHFLGWVSLTFSSFSTLHEKKTVPLFLPSFLSVLLPPFKSNLFLFPAFPYHPRIL